MCNSEAKAVMLPSKSSLILLRVLKDSSLFQHFSTDASFALFLSLCTARLTNFVEISQSSRLQRAPTPPPPRGVISAWHACVLRVAMLRPCCDLSCAFLPFLSVLQGAQEVLAGALRPHLLRRAPQKSRRM